MHGYIQCNCKHNYKRTLYTNKYDVAIEQINALYSLLFKSVELPLKSLKSVF